MFNVVKIYDSVSCFTNGDFELSERSKQTSVASCFEKFKINGCQICLLYENVDNLNNLPNIFISYILLDQRFK